MRRIPSTSLALAFAAFLAFFSSGWMAGATPSRSKVHGFTLTGTITSVDDSQKTLVVKSSNGKSTTLVWTNATFVFGGKLTAGQSVTLRYLDREGKHVATSIRIAAVPGSPTPLAVAPTPTATPRRTAPVS